jgi:hypothetical protein
MNLGDTVFCQASASPHVLARNGKLKFPRAGRNSLRMRFEAPRFSRHDGKNGCRLSEGADVTFENVMLQTGRE